MNNDTDPFRPRDSPRLLIYMTVLTTVLFLMNLAFFLSIGLIAWIQYPKLAPIWTTLVPQLETIVTAINTFILPAAENAIEYLPRISNLVTEIETVLTQVASQC